MYNNNFFVRIKIFFLERINKIRNRKIKFGKCKNWNVRVRKYEGWKMYGSEEYGKDWKGFITWK